MITMITENTNSSTGVLEDLLTALINACAMEYHYKAQLDKTFRDMQDDVTVDVFEDTETSLLDATRLRRTIQLALYDSAVPTEGNVKDKSKWCLVKHACITLSCVFESYQANQEYYPLYTYANELAAKIIAQFLGVDVEPCMACLSDYFASLTTKGEDYVS